MKKGIGGGTGYAFGYREPDGFYRASGGYGPDGESAAAPLPPLDPFARAWAHWPMEENVMADRVDTLGNMPPFAVVGTVEDGLPRVQGKIGNATQIGNLSADSIYLEADVSSLGDISLLPGLSLTWWVKRVSLVLNSSGGLRLSTGAENLFYFGDSSVPGAYEVAQISGANACGVPAIGVTLDPAGFGDTYHLFALSYDGLSGELKYSIDGSPLALADTIPVTQGCEPIPTVLMLKTYTVNGENGGHDFDQVIMWKEPITDDDIAYVFNGGDGRVFPVAP